MDEKRLIRPVRIQLQRTATGGEMVVNMLYQLDFSCVELRTPHPFDGSSP